jgi:hypothetical protein
MDKFTTLAEFDGSVVESWGSCINRPNLVQFKALGGGNSSRDPIMSTQRRNQMFPRLGPEEIERVRQFGEVRRYKSGGALVYDR